MEPTQKLKQLQLLPFCILRLLELYRRSDDLGVLAHSSWALSSEGSV